MANNDNDPKKPRGEQDDLSAQFADASRGCDPGEYGVFDSPEFGVAELVWAQRMVHLAMVPSPAAKAAVDEMLAENAADPQKSEVFWVHITSSPTHAVIGYATAAEVKRVEEITPLEIMGMGMSVPTFLAFAQYHGLSMQDEVSLLHLDPKRHEIVLLANGNMLTPILRNPGFKPVLH